MKRPIPPTRTPPGPRPSLSGACYRLTLEYDGTGFSGWQEQKNARSIVGELKSALADAGFEVVDLGGSGRTDAGVHALAQVAHLRLSRPTDPPSLANALNSRLPGGIQVLSVEPTSPRFHARHDAQARCYLYQLSRRRTAFAKRYVWWVKDELDLARMREAAQHLLGRRDYALFAEPGGTPEKSTLVDMVGVEVEEQGALVLLRFVASHFLWKMVRRLTGTLVEIGAGRLDLADFVQLLEAEPLPAAKGRPTLWTAPASGLFLERILYRDEPPLGPLSAVTPLKTAAEIRAQPAENKRRPPERRRPHPADRPKRWK